ncbi:MAG TPA: hypothetical protein VKH44_07875, partial [Pirellulaceae bacterium]|nr:hypothetical protein [Pirellulaceae bacterium]
MAIRYSLRWLRALASSPTRHRHSLKSSPHRRIHLEQLEARYVLTLPVAVDDFLFIEESHVIGLNTVGQIPVLKNDTDAIAVGQVNLTG